MNKTDQGFDAFLREALAPAERPEDLAFVARVQAVARVEDRLAAESRALGRRLARDIGAILALGAGMVATMAAPSLASMAAADQPVALAVLMAGFSAWVGLLAMGDSPSTRSRIGSLSRTAELNIEQQ